MSIDGGIVALPPPGGSLEDRSIGGDLILLGPPPEPLVPATTQLSGLEILALDTLLLTFDREMAVIDSLLDVASYTITPNAAGQAVAVRDVVVGASLETTTQVVLVVSNPTRDEVYTLTLDDGLLGADGGTMNPDFLSLQFAARATKMDRFLKGTPALYAHRHRTRLRMLAHAMFREDDKIGGTQDDFLG